jgi:hypothetical protein
MGDCRGSESRNESLALSPDRQRFATLSPQNGYTQLSIGALAGGGEPVKFDIPSVSGPLGWLDDRYVLSQNDGIILDTQNGAAICKATANGRVGRAGDGTYWLYNNRKESPALARTSFPSASLLSKLAATQAAPVQPVVGPGTRLAIAGGFDTDPASMQQHEAAFKERGWILDPSAPLKFSASTKQEPSKSVEYTSILSREKQTVNVEGATIMTIVLTDGQGKELWQSGMSKGGGYAPSFVTLNQGQSLQDKVNNSSNYQLKANVSGFPALIFPRDAYNNLGVVQVTDKGEKF